jgi:hypothetical protein
MATFYIYIYTQPLPEATLRTQVFKLNSPVRAWTSSDLYSTFSINCPQWFENCRAVTTLTTIKLDCHRCAGQLCQTFSAHFVTESLLMKSENPPRTTTIMFPRECLANLLDCCISGILRRARPQHSKMSKQSGPKEELARIKRSQTRGSQLLTPCMAGTHWNLQDRIPPFQLSSSSRVNGRKPV